MSRSRNNPLALALLVSLLERPMHPYEVATTLRQRAKERSVKLNYGALYGVVESLRKRGLIAPKETERAGRLPERTIYELTDSGRRELIDWLSGLISTPTLEFPDFVAALSLLPALSPDQILDLLKERLQHLTLESVQAEAIRDLLQKHGMPRLFWLDEEFRNRMRAAEIEYVVALVRDIESGDLDGSAWWKESHEVGFGQVPPPFDPLMLQLMRQQLNQLIPALNHEQEEES